MSVDSVLFLYCHWHSLSLDLPQILIGLFQFIRWSSWHSTLSPPIYHPQAAAEKQTWSSYSIFWQSLMPPHCVHIVQISFFGIHSPSSCPSFRLSLITLLNDSAQSSSITWFIYCPSIFPWLSHFGFSFMVFWFSGRHFCTPLAEQLLPSPPGPASLLTLAWELPLCYFSDQTQWTCSLLCAHRKLSMPLLCHLSHSVCIFFYIISSREGALFIWKIPDIESREIVTSVMPYPHGTN